MFWYFLALIVLLFSGILLYYHFTMDYKRTVIALAVLFIIVLVMIVISVVDYEHIKVFI